MHSTMPECIDESLLPAARASGRVIVLLGPTAGGKSDLAMELARRLGGELISADSMQIYRGMDIGTAKPTASERAEISHHALDLVDATEDGFTVASWLALADQTVSDLQARGRVPIIVGGTNLYIRAFLEGLDEAPAADAAFRAQLDGVSSEELHAKLALSDSATAQRLHPNDRRRITRALEIAHVTGQPASLRRSAWTDEGVAPRRSDLFTVTLDWPVDLINRRINARVRVMFEQGFVAEVERLRSAGGLCMQARGALGYAEILAALGDGSREPRASSLEQAAEATKIRSRQLAKQQRTWLRRFALLKPSLSLPCSETTTTAQLADACVAALARV